MKSKVLSKYYHMMLLPGMIMLIIFSVVPMFGLVMAFQDFVPSKGIFASKFVGLHNFRLMLMFPDARQVILNTFVIAVLKIIFNLITPVGFALLLNECRTLLFKKTVQTVVYLPNFLSWVIVAVMFSNIFSYNGIVNKMLQILGMNEPIMFMANNDWFRPIVVLSDVWKNFGFGAIVYIAAITGIDASICEAANIDGASRLQKMWYITIPGISSTIIIMATLSLGNILNAGFDQIYNMYNPIVYRTGDILDTYVYRVGLEKLQYSFGTAVGLFKSLISFILIALSYKLADRFAGYRIF